MKDVTMHMVTQLFVGCNHRNMVISSKLIVLFILGNKVIVSFTQKNGLSFVC